MFLQHEGETVHKSTFVVILTENTKHNWTRENVAQADMLLIDRNPPVRMKD